MLDKNLDINKIKNFLDSININEYKLKIEKINSKINELLNTNIYLDSKNIKDLMNELEINQKIISLYELIHNYLETYNSIKNYLLDSEIKELAEVEIIETEKKLINSYNKIVILLLGNLEYDDKNAVFEIRPGIGGVEACIFANDLFQMYIKYLQKKKYSFTIHNIEYNIEGGIDLVVFEITKSKSYAEFRFESGVHRVQRIPKTESSGRIHTSTASVTVIPKFEYDEIKLNMNEIKVEVYRSSGPGGQSVNTTDSAVRVTHLPTNIVVTCQNSRSQHQNKEYALAILYSKLKQIEVEKFTKTQQNFRQQVVQNTDRSAKIRTYNFHSPELQTIVY